MPEWYLQYFTTKNFKVSDITNQSNLLVVTIHAAGVVQHLLLWKRHGNSNTVLSSAAASTLETFKVYQ